MAKIIHRIEYEFSEDDFRELKKDLKSPCSECGENRSTCCGCEEFNIYTAKVNKLKNANLYDIKQNMDQAIYYYGRAMICKESIEEYIKNIPEDVIVNIEDLRKARSFVELNS